MGQHQKHINEFNIQHFDAHISSLLNFIYIFIYSLSEWQLDICNTDKKFIVDKMMRLFGACLWPARFSLPSSGPGRLFEICNSIYYHYFLFLTRIIWWVRAFFLSLVDVICRWEFHPRLLIFRSHSKMRNVIFMFRFVAWIRRNECLPQRERACDYLLWQHNRISIPKSNDLHITNIKYN